MPYVPLNVILEQKLLPGGTLTLPYPRGKNEGNFFSAINHTMGVDASFFRSPRDFIVTTTEDRIVLTWRNQRTLPQGALLNIQLEEPGGDFFYDARTGVTVQHMVSSSVFMVNLGAPRNEIADLYVEAMSIPDRMMLPLTGNRTQIARNVVIHASDDISDRAFRIDGEDFYNNPMTEYINGPSSGRSEGKKAFSVIHRVSVNGPCAGRVSVGSGNRLGLPVYLPAPGFVLRELVNGERVDGGLIIAGSDEVPDATTGDRRGTYTPPSSVVMDGKKAIYLLLSLPNPGNIGIPDYAE